MDSKAIISIIGLSVVIGFFGGTMFKQCPDCVQETPKTITRPVINTVVEETKKTIKNETKHEINKTLSDSTIHYADSILRNYAKHRFNHDK